MIAAKTARALKDLRSEKAKLEAVQLEVSAQVGEEGKLFGSVTSANVAELFAEQGLEVDRRKVVLDTVKEVGEYDVEVRLHREVVAKLKLNVKAAE